MAQKFQAPRGTNDITPGQRVKEPEFEIHRWQSVEKAYSFIARQYGYEEIRTPMFEDIELFLRSSGETSDVVSKEMYDFFDKGDRHIALKPEGTAPAMRAYLEHSLGSQGGATRLWYFSHSFRYGRPQKGRYRQLHQFGAELIGSSSPHADAEIIELVVRFFESIGLAGVKVMINSIGRAQTRDQYRSVILDHVRGWMKDQDSEAQAKAEKNPMRLLDSKDPALKEILTDLPSILNYLEADSRTHFDHVQKNLEEADVSYVINDSVVRGLDYYTDTVFEVVSENLGESLSLCGGGRYDNLIEQIGGPKTPSVGVGIGVERILLTLEQQGKTIEREKPLAFVVAATDDAHSSVRKIVRNLRSAGFAVGWDIDERKMKQQLKAADRAEARYSVILGSDELKDGTVTIKDMSSSNQEVVNQERIIEWLNARV